MENFSPARRGLGVYDLDSTLFPFKNLLSVFYESKQSPDVVISVFDSKVSVNRLTLSPLGNT